MLLLFLGLLAQACVSWPTRAEYLRRGAFKRQELKQSDSDGGENRAADLEGMKKTVFFEH